MSIIPLWLVLTAIPWPWGACDATLITVTHQGIGTGSVKGGSVDCGSNCTVDVPSGGSTTLTFYPDSSGAGLIGWGGQCAQYQQRQSCTVTVNDANDHRFHGEYPVVFVTGYWQNGVCRGHKPDASYLYFWSAQEAWNAAQAGTITGRIECNTGFYPLVPSGSVPVTISGGWGSFMPNVFPEEGSMTYIAGPITLGPSTPLLTIGGDTVNGNGGITIVGGYRTLTGPVVVNTEPMIIPNGPYDLGVIIK